MSRTHLLAIATCGAAASVMAIAPAALAATPKAGTYVQMKNNRELMHVVVYKGHVSDAEHYDKCVTVPIFSSDPKIKVTNGKFSWTGKVTDVANRRWQLHVDGNFVTSKKVTGHWSAKELVGGSCTSTFTYTATLHS